MSNTLWLSTRKGLIQYTRQGLQWQPVATHFLGDPVSFTLHDGRDNAVYAALNLGHFGPKLHRSDDGGKSWQEIACPKLPEQKEGEQDKSNSVQMDSVQMIWSMAAGGADQPGRIWAGTIPGALFRSDDRGDSWQLVESLWQREERKQWFGGGYDQPGIHSICVDPRDSQCLRLAVSCGGVWLSEDDGKTWHSRAKGLRNAYMPPERAYDEIVQDPHLMVQCQAQPDWLWIQHHNGIFVSDNGAESWREVEDVKPSVFGFAVAVHPEDGRRAWFVPGIKDERRLPVDQQLLVNETRDGGKSFTAHRQGLPTEPSYDLIYRHALAIDSSGQILAMASTTGNCWLSADQGQSWQCLSNYLPPVAAVCFGPEQA